MREKTEVTSSIASDITTDNVTGITTGFKFGSASKSELGGASGIQQQNRPSVIESTSSVYQACGRPTTSTLPLKKRPIKQDEPPAKKQVMSSNVIVSDSLESEEEKND